MLINMDGTLGVNVIFNSISSAKTDIMVGGGGGVMIGGGGGVMVGGDGSNMGDNPGGSLDTNSAKGIDGLLANWGFVGGVSAATLAVSIVLGILLAKKRIKKGIDPYEN